MSILSRVPDDVGFYYGFIKGDGRQVNVRYEERTTKGNGYWYAYLGGEPVPNAGEDAAGAFAFRNKNEAEAGAIRYAKSNPEED
jgi:hypothetical protein